MRHISKCKNQCNIQDLWLLFFPEAAADAAAPRQQMQTMLHWLRRDTQCSALNNLSVCAKWRGSKQGFSAPLRHTCRSVRFLHTSWKPHKATRNLKRNEDKGLVQKYFISQEEMFFQESILTARDCMIGIMCSLELHSGDKVYICVKLQRSTLCTR